PSPAAKPKVAKAVAVSAPTTAQREAAGKRGATKRATEDAAAGVMPSPPDFSAQTHARFRGKLAEVVAMVEAGDVEGLKAFHINPVSTSPKAIDRYRNLAVIALEARAAERAPMERPGELAAEIQAETGMSYAAALVAANCD
ncbi:MAG: hypothetical protein K2X68_01225, partial [Novosphingobium sp.]|nr:hypothetical protein [Novosphingobium sp.]